MNVYLYNYTCCIPKHIFFLKNGILHVCTNWKTLQILKPSEINQGEYIGMCSSHSSILYTNCWNYKDNMCSVDK